MKRKISILSLSIVLTIILFATSTYMQRKLISYEPKTKCFIILLYVVCYGAAKIIKNKRLEEFFQPTPRFIQRNCLTLQSET